jgi:hypothetical protein
MRTLCLVMGLAILLQGSGVEGQTNPARSFSFDVADSRGTIYHDIGNDLVLRAVKQDVGWSVQVTRKPAGRKSSWNLLFRSSRWHGPHPSDIYAWHVKERYFSNERVLAVRGYPYEVRVALINPLVEGEGPQARFKSGTVRISWRRTRRGHAPPDDGVHPTADTPPFIFQ